MANSNIFSLSKSDLNPFLYSDVGTELNGSNLTVLSVLARLGQDPWTEAGRLSKLSTSAATDWLTDTIKRTPLTAQAIGEARATAARLVLLLPAHTKTTEAPAAAEVEAKVAAPPRAVWVLVAMLLGTLTFGLAASHVFTPGPPTVSNHVDARDH